MLLKNFIYIFIVFFFCCNSTTSNKIHESPIKCIQVKQVFPTIEKDGKISKYDSNFVNIYYHEGLTLYQLSYHYSYSKEGQKIIDEDRTHFFIHKSEDSFGYDYDKNKSDSGIKVNADSMLNNQWITISQVYPMIFKNNSKLISSKLTSDSSILDEVYTYWNKSDTTINGRIYLSFNKQIKDIEYSLSKELDSIKSMKLYKVKFVQNPTYVKEFKTMLDSFYIIHDFKEAPVDNPEEIFNYFDRYKKDALQYSIK